MLGLIITTTFCLQCRMLSGIFALHYDFACNYRDSMNLNINEQKLAN